MKSTLGVNFHKTYPPHLAINHFPHVNNFELHLMTMSVHKSIPFHKPLLTGKESQASSQWLTQPVLDISSINEQCLTTLRNAVDYENVLLTSSCTHALETAIMSLRLTSQDEVIVPSFTFMSVPNAVIREKAQVIFADIDPHTMNLDLNDVRQKLSPNTRAIITMHYAGLSYNPWPLVNFCNEHDLILIEDAAHCIGATWEGRALGTFGDFGAISFHQTKNIHCGEGGALIYTTELEDAVLKIIDKGTNRSDFHEGKIDRYDWVTLGSSFTMSALCMPFLMSQLHSLSQVTAQRQTIWRQYHQLLSPLDKQYFHLPPIDAIEEGNGHIFFIRLFNEDDRQPLIDYMKEKGVNVYFHYPALHESPAVHKLNIKHSHCPVASQESKRLLRLPIYPDLSQNDVEFICEKLNLFFQSR